jgi:zinc D-Ala-D-Ala carboxypeptidase
MITLNSHNEADALVFYFDQMGENYKVSRNFKLREFASKCGSNQVVLHPAIMIGVQALRDALQVPIRITSGYRTPSHNASVGGAKNSYHVKGMACDVRTDEFTPEEIATVARSLGLVARPYDTFCHIDVGTPRTW